MLVRCVCGRESLVSGSDLIKGKSSQCRRCYGTDQQNLIGKLFGDWRVVDWVPKKHRRTYWKCRCKCGDTHEVCQQTLLNGTSTRCCKCYWKEHVQSSKENYAIWNTMIARCENPKNCVYENYGKRGIKVCERWHDIDLFNADMGTRPSKAHSIDRIDNDGDYCPENCRWAVSQTQANNTRSNRKITYQGMTKTVSQWARAMGLKPETLFAYLKRHSFEEAAKFYGYKDSPDDTPQKSEDLHSAETC